MGLGVPFNIASASLLMNILGHLTGLVPRELVHHIGDAHIYTDHIEPLQRQIQRTPMPFPILQMKDRGQTKVEDFELDDFTIEGYTPYPGIKMKMAV
jgi:thymidylate synthase